MAGRHHAVARVPRVPVALLGLSDLAAGAPTHRGCGAHPGVRDDGFDGGRRVVGIGAVTNAARRIVGGRSVGGLGRSSVADDGQPGGSGAAGRGLAINAMLAEPAVWPVYVLTAAIAGASGVDSPTRSAAIPRLVGTTHLQTALSLQQALFQLSAVIGPAIAGFLILRVHLASAFWIDALTFGAAFLALLMMKPMLPEHGVSRGAGSVFEGFRFLKGRQSLQGVYLVDLNAMIFGAPRVLFPEFGTVVLGGNAATVAMLYAAPGVGALIVALFSGWVPKVRRAGRAVLIAVGVWGVAVIAFGLASSLNVALVALAVAGAADMISAVFRGTILQLSIPDRLRGRLSAMQIAVVTGGPGLVTQRPEHSPVCGACGRAPGLAASLASLVWPSSQPECLGLGIGNVPMIRRTLSLKPASEPRQSRARFTKPRWRNAAT